MDDYKDGGYKSRKMVLTYVVILLITIGFVATGKWSSLSVAYGEYIMGLLAAASIYAGGNTAIKWMALKAGSKKSAKKPVEPEDAPRGSADVD